MKALIITDTLAGHAACADRFAAHFDRVTCVELRVLHLALRTLAAPEPEIVVLDIMRSPTKCLAVVARLRAVFPQAKILVQKQAKPSNFEYLAEQVGAHGVADIRNTGVADVKVMLAAVLGGNITRR
ncbi:hypothetical protein LMG3458_02934 [Achromobacter deleyi]|uniref:Response regulatory domain-containing protein n=1 Tax=Achromobacter deleyi TaxID=1353891 RepID=A0A6S7A4M6_9BURK|nr:hypothetical protein [Achromobacter deleyi]CAB3706113.1 hypothetical protein LMG3458_02934 [Achromobacter deleyi]CAB3880314.1 hypothetical protein LMG3482_03260 [Achromobacter deleyi]CAB3895459.1 hypothetical protein LMG3412_03972 [Achromobacter deleyi]CAB3911549.1 hypothetical protein LMG3481_04803 [Achromobacter deleyi]